MSLLATVAAMALGHAQIDPNIIIWRTYKAGAYSKAQDQAIVEIDNSAEYQRYLNNFQPQGAGDGRDVVWGKEMLVAIHVGSRNTGGYSVEVDSIAKTKPTEALVSWAELTPVHGVATSQSLTSPWTIVRLNRPGVRLTYRGHKEEGRLPGGIKIINFPGYDWGCDCCRACVREQAARLPFRTYSEGADAPGIIPATVVMGSPTDFANYVRNYQMSGLGDGSDVDWDHERLLAIHLGRKITGGSILLDHVEIVDPSRVDVSWYQIDPTNAPLTLGSARNPFLIVRIPRVGSLVTFTKHVVRDIDPIVPDTCNCACENCKHCRHH